MTDETIKDINDFLAAVVKNSHRCQHCSLLRYDNVCFFAYECIQRDFYYFNEED